MKARTSILIGIVAVAIAVAAAVPAPAQAHATSGVPYHTQPTNPQCLDLGQSQNNMRIVSIFFNHPRQIVGFTSERIYYRLVSARWTSSGWAYGEGEWVSAWTTTSGLVNATGSSSPWSSYHQNSIDLWAGTTNWIGFQIYYSSQNYYHPIEWLNQYTCN